MTVTAPSSTSAISSRLPELADGHETAARLREYLSDLLGEPLQVSGLERMEGGWSRQTHRVRVRTAAGSDLALCLRSEVTAGVAERNLDREWRVMSAVAGGDVPLPRLYGFEATAEVMGDRFIAMEWVPGDVPNPWRRSGKQYLAEAGRRGRLGPDWVHAIARLHSPEVAARLQAADLDGGLTSAGQLRREVDHWSALVMRAANHPGALVVEACHWLDDNLPAAPDPPTALHGDLRMGNFILAEDRVAAFLDWEMAGLGDWRTDLGYCLMPYNGGKLLEAGPATAGGLMHPEAFLEGYAAETTRFMQPRDALYFMILGAVKMIAIFCTGIDQYMAGSAADPRFAWLSIPLAGLVDDLQALLDSDSPW